MEVKTCELTGPALDWAVASIEKMPKDAESVVNGNPVVLRTYWGEVTELRCEFSTNWAQGGPIIEREEIGLNAENGEWYADCYNPRDIVHCQCYGPTPLIAAMRCYVASKFGDRVEVPDELMK